LKTTQVKSIWGGVPHALATTSRDEIDLFSKWKKRNQFLKPYYEMLIFCFCDKKKLKTIHTHYPKNTFHDNRLETEIQFLENFATVSHPQPPT
jgi:hypothetical protein